MLWPVSRPSHSARPQVSPAVAFSAPPFSAFSGSQRFRISRCGRSPDRATRPTADLPRQPSRLRFFSPAKNGRPEIDQRSHAVRIFQSNGVVDSNRHACRGRYRCKGNRRGSVCRQSSSVTRILTADSLYYIPISPRIQEESASRNLSIRTSLPNPGTVC